MSFVKLRQHTRLFFAGKCRLLVDQLYQRQELLFSGFLCIFREHLCTYSCAVRQSCNIKIKMILLIMQTVKQTIQRILQTCYCVWIFPVHDIYYSFIYCLLQGYGNLVG